MLKGIITVKGNKALVGLGNYNSELLFLLHKKLNEFEIICSEPRGYDITKYFGADGYGHNQIYWTLNISRKGSLLKLFDMIEPHIKHENKTESLKKARINILERNKKFGGGT